MKLYIIACLVLMITACSAPAGKMIKVKDEFDAVEKIVGTANWQSTSTLPGFNDTSFLYFSRTGNTRFNVYYYRLREGDSTMLRTDSIINRNDSVIWISGNDDQMLLKPINDSAFTLQGISKKRNLITFVKKDSLHIIVADSSKSFLAMKKTLPLGVFLVRKRYDYLHGTSYADSAEVLPRGMHR